MVGFDEINVLLYFLFLFNFWCPQRNIHTELFDIMAVQSMEQDDVRRVQRRYDRYASIKSVSQNFLNATIIQILIAYVFTLWNLTNANPGFRIAATILVAVELSIRLVVTVLLVIVNRASDIDEKTKCCRIKTINNTISAFTSILFFVNMVTNYLVTNDIKSANGLVGGVVSSNGTSNGTMIA